MAQYTATTSPFTLASAATDILTITGSATKTVRVQYLALNASQTTEGLNVWSLVRRSTANSGGTSTPLTIIQKNSLEPVPTATVLLYSANPTLGTLVGTIRKDTLSAPSLLSVLSDAIYDWLLIKFSGDEGAVLNGTSECLAINFNGAAIPAGLTCSFTIEWDES